jgi:Transposase and inactivated derivatives
MSKNFSSRNRHQVVTVELDSLVPKDHLVRQIEKAIDFTFVYPLVEPYYSTKGRPSIDPIVLIKLIFLQMIFGIPSMRQTIKEVDTNVAYRWFLGYGLTDKVMHFSTFGKNYSRRFSQTDVFEEIFNTINKQAVSYGLIDASTLYLDSTHIKANANKNKSIKQAMLVEPKVFQKELEAEINKERAEVGKYPFEFTEESEVRTRTISTTDPDCGLFIKGEHERQFAYSAHTISDVHGFVLATDVKPSNIHDSQVAPLLTERILSKYPQAEHLVADAGYKTPIFTKYLLAKGLRPVLPYTRPRGKKGLIRKNEFVYDEYYDCYLCPNNQVLSFSTINRKGYREYKSDPSICYKCPLLANCIHNKQYQRQITRHVWEDALEIADDLRLTPLNKKLYERRKETIERIFADAKEKHGLRWTKYRSLRKVSNFTMLTFAAMNLKKIAKWLWDSLCLQLKIAIIINNTYKNTEF